MKKVLSQILFRPKKKKKQAEIQMPGEGRGILQSPRKKVTKRHSRGRKTKGTITGKGGG